MDRQTWDRALEALGTPKDFVEGSYVTIHESDRAGERALIQIISPGFAKRRQLMQGARRVACHLCDSVAQALSGEGERSNLLAPWGTYGKGIHVPNKFASVFEHGLFVAKEHDDPKKSRIEQMQERVYLEEVGQLCRANDLFAANNHPRAGMSVPGHEHAHVVPVILYKKDGTHVNLRRAYGEGCLAESNFGSSVKTPLTTRFDTLAFLGDEGQIKAYKVMKRLEADGKIFTFCQLSCPDLLLLTPHLREVERAKRAGTNAGAPQAEYFMIFGSEGEAFQSHQEFIDFYSNVFPMRGEFDWGKYVS